MSAKGLAFLELFPGCEGLSGMCGGLDKATVQLATVDEDAYTMKVEATFARQPAPQELELIESELAEEYGFFSVRISADYEHSDKQASKVLYGKGLKEPKLSEMGSLNLESGAVTVKGEVFAVNNREIQKRGASVLCFDMTDHTGSIRVSKFFDKSEDAAVLGKVKAGQTLIVRGRVTYNKFDNDMALEPYSIILGEAEVRPDEAKEKRVELHLHTRYSTLDALTDIEKVIKRAAQWGHRAIAVTDHGTAQAFPEMSKFGKKNGVKIIYGLEGYYVNDVEERPAVRGKCHNLLDCEFVAFDVETTGLSAVTDRLTEIGGCTDPKRFDEVLADAAAAHDSVGGIVECCAERVPVCLGEPFFDSAESLIAHLLFAIPAVKGVEFGSGFAAARHRGSENNDPILDAEGHTATNHDGGINGGITNGNPLVVRAALKPTPSIARPQMTYNRVTGRVEMLEIRGRHDVCVALRGAVVVEAAVAIVLADLFAGHPASTRTAR